MEGDQHRNQGWHAQNGTPEIFKRIFHLDSICPGGFVKVAGMMNTNQMELSLKARQMRATAAQKQRRQQRAQWWFGQMRRVVAASLEWKPQKVEG
jgi:hypothetical protein